MTNVFAEGAAAFVRWKDSPTPDNEFAQDKNPYPEGSEEFDNWDTGWEDAFHLICRSWEE